MKIGMSILIAMLATVAIAVEPVTYDVEFHEPQGRGYWNRFTVRAGDATAEGIGWGLNGGWSLVDIDTLDTFTEVAVHDDGPSADPELKIYRYVDGELVNLGSIEGGFGKWESRRPATLDGSGVVRGTCRMRLIHTWYHECEYVMENGKLVCRPLEWVAMNHPVTLRVPLRLRESPDGPELPHEIPAGTEAVLGMTDDMRWCELVAGDIRGWFEVEGNCKVGGRLSHEVFDGLVIAD